MRDIQSRQTKLRERIAQADEQFRLNMIKAHKATKRACLFLGLLCLGLVGLALWLLTHINWLVVGEILGRFLGAVQTGMHLKGQ